MQNLFKRSDGTKGQFVSQDLLLDPSHEWRQLSLTLLTLNTSYHKWGYRVAFLTRGVIRVGVVEAESERGAIFIASRIKMIVSFTVYTQNL